MLLTAFAGASALLSLALTPLTKALARRLGAMDMPGPAKVHTTPMPRLGGLAIWATVLLIATPMVWVLSKGGHSEVRGILSVLGAGLVCAFMGALDDRHSLSARARAVVQLVVAIGLVAGGVRVGGLPLLIGGLLSFMWLMGAVNAVNLIDGLDGLAAGACAVSAVFLSLIGWGQGKMAEAMLGACVAGSCLGFLAYNFPPASVFMGDNGSVFLGCVLGGLALSLAREPDGLAQFVGGILCLGLPVMDVLLVMLRRVMQRQRLFGADRGHFYDQLMHRCGLSQWQTVAVAYGVTALLGFAGLVAARASLPVALTIAGGLFTVAMLFAWFSGMLSYKG